MRFIAKGKRSFPKEMVGEFPEPEHHAILLTNNSTVLDASGNIILKLIRNAAPLELADEAQPHAARIADKYPSDNRAKYSGQHRVRLATADGFSKQSRTAKPVASAVAGSFEQQGGRIRGARYTAARIGEPESWEVLERLSGALAQTYRENARSRFQRQEAWVQKHIHSDWLIKGTPFTTITLNNKVRAAYHTDGGDLKVGLGLLYVMGHGFTGHDLVVPEYNVAARLQHNDLLLFDPTVVHANTECHADGEYERTSLVFYVRKLLSKAGSAVEELAKAKAATTPWNDSEGATDVPS